MRELGDELGVEHLPMLVDDDDGTSEQAIERTILLEETIAIGEAVAAEGKQRYDLVQTLSTAEANLCEGREIGRASCRERV